MQLNKNSYFLATLLISILLAAVTALPAHAASDTAFDKLTIEDLYFGLFVVVPSIVACIVASIVLSGHYGFKSNPILAERICYSLGAILVVKAASAERLPATTSTVLALAASALTYYIFSRLRPNG